MSYFIYIGRNKGNLYGLSSKGYHIVRKGLDITITHGPVEILGRNKKRIIWCKGYKTDIRHFSTSQEAVRYKIERIKRRLSNGYEKIDSKIYKR